MLERLDRTLHANLNARYRVGLLRIWNDKLLFVVEKAITISIVYFGAQFVFAGQMTLGELIAFHLLAEKVTDPIENFSRLWESWQNVRVSRQRLGDVVNAQREPFDALPRLPPQIEGRLEFRNVDFAYTPSASVLQNFSFRAEPHTLTLVIGPSGSGKSTFGRLSSGIDVPDAGEVLLGGKSIAQHDPHRCSDPDSLCSPGTIPVLRTLRENLVLGDDSATDEMDRAGLADFRRRGADRSVAAGPGTPRSASAGPRSPEARGNAWRSPGPWVRRPKVIFLDEPTSALDGSAQRRMATELGRLKREATLVVITHSPDIFENPDQIVDFEALQ